MAGSKSDWYENRVLNLALRGATLTPAITPYVALFTGTLTNALAVTFPAPTAAWGSVTHFGVFDAVTAGNALYYGDLTTARTINSGDSAPSFAVAALTLTEG